jgi:L-ascorbate metabolism protein UlaG (beta-lactamase superfamily)
MNSKILFLLMASGMTSAFPFEQDSFDIGGKKLTIGFIGHGSIVLEYDKTVIQVDPYGKLADYATLPKADIILVTHEHPDHLDPDAVAKVTKPGTLIIANAKAAAQLPKAVTMANGDTKKIGAIEIKAVPAYNTTPERLQFHPKGNVNGYILTIGGKKIYIAGDTEDIPEMRALKDIYIAFLPMNLPYTMTPEQVAEAAKAFRPRILYPYHRYESDPDRVVELLKNEKDIEVRIRKMK